MKSLDLQQLEYYLHFDPLQDNGSIVRRIDLASGGEHCARVSIDDHDFKHRIQQQFPSVIADVIDLAVAIHAADRLTIQDQRQRQIQLRVVLPVRHPEILNQSALNVQLCHLLEWATDKQWGFEFERRCQPGRSIENQAQQPTQCGYCSSCLLRKQALAASQLADKTEYIVPHGNPPAENSRLYLESMLAQVATLRERLKPSNTAADPWQALTQRFPELNDIVDRTHAGENMTLLQMRLQLIRLFHTYACEWNTVEQSLFEQFEPQTRSVLGIQESQDPIQQELLLR